MSFKALKELPDFSIPLTAVSSVVTAPCSARRSGACRLSQQKEKAKIVQKPGLDRGLLCRKATQR